MTSAVDGRPAFMGTPSGGYNAPVIRTPQIAILAFVFFAAGSMSEVRGQSVMTLGVSLAAQTQPSGDCDFACGLPRSAYGGTFSFGHWLTPRVAIGTEMSVGAVLRGRQQIRIPGGHIESDTSHQDMIFAGTGHWSLQPVDRSINGIFVGGIGVALRQTRRTGPFRMVDGTSSMGWPGSVTDYVPTVVSGFDMPFRVYRLVWLVPSIRLHYLFDEDGSSEYPKRGVDNLLMNVGARVAIQF